MPTAHKTLRGQIDPDRMVRGLGEWSQVTTGSAAEIEHARTRSERGREFLGHRFRAFEYVSIVSEEFIPVRHTSPRFHDPSASSPGRAVGEL
jgi:hypothetical protein